LGLIFFASVLNDWKYILLIPISVFSVKIAVAMLDKSNIRQKAYFHLQKHLFSEIIVSLSSNKPAWHSAIDIHHRLHTYNKTQSIANLKSELWLQ
jgi:hypothetical protein